MNSSRTKILNKIYFIAIACLIALSFGLLSPAFVTAINSISAAVDANSNVVIQITNYKTNYNYEDDIVNYTVSDSNKQGYKLPSAAITNLNGTSLLQNGNGDITIAVTNSAGKIIPTDKVANSNNTSYDFYLPTSAVKTGSYNITYTGKNTGDDTTVATRDIKIKITSRDFSLELQDNSEQIIPSSVVAGDVIVLPYPKVVYSDDTETVLGSTDVNQSLTVKLIGSDLAERQLTTNAQNYLTYTVKDTDEGKFDLSYAYTENNNTVTTGVKTINIVKTKPEVELKHDDFSFSISNLNFATGEEVELPVPVTVNGKAGNTEVSVYTTVTITNTSLEDGNPDKVTVLSDFSKTFTPKQDGNYKIVYTSVDFYGNKKVSTYWKNNVVKTSNSISVYVTEDYTAEQATTGLTTEQKTDIDYDIPSLIYMNGTEREFTFPAIYGEGKWGDYSDLTLTRSLYKEGSQKSIFENITKPNSEDKYLPGESVPYKFTSAGNYTISYEVSYKDQSNTTKTKTFSFKVVETDTNINEIKSDFNLQVPTITKTARIGDKITFGAPYITDYVKDTTDVADNNHKLIVQVKLMASNTEVYTEYLVMNDEDLYEFNVKKPTSITDEIWNTVTALQFHFEAYNDFGQTAQDDANVAIINFSSDKDAPTISNVDSLDFSSIATDIIKDKVLNLPVIEFTDASSDIVVTAQIIKDGSVVATLNASTTGRTVKFENKTYTPSETGTYTILYTATDQNSNKVYFSKDFNVVTVYGYAVSIANPGTQEYGAHLKLTDYITTTLNGVSSNPANILVIDETVTVDQDYLTNVLANDTLLIQVIGAYTYPSANWAAGEIVALEGTITVQAWAKVSDICDFNNNASAKIEFTASDTTGPSFTIEDETLGNKPYEFSNDASKNEITLPWFGDISDNGSGVDPKSMKITVKYKGASSNITEFTYENANDINKFTPTKNGKIEVIYSVKDTKGNEATRTFTLSVGDVTPPIITLTDDCFNTAKKIGDTVVIYLDKIGIDDSDLNFDDLVIKVKLGSEDVDVTRDNKEHTLSFVAASAGTYTISFDLTDDANNEAQTQYKTITVTADTSSNVNSTTIWGTVLIIVALIVLALVIFFFVKPTKSKTNNPVATRNTDKEKKDKE